MFINSKPEYLPLPGDSVKYRDKLWDVLEYNFDTDDLKIKCGDEEVNIKRLDIFD